MKITLKKQPIIQQLKTKQPPNWPSCKRNIWVEFDKRWVCQIRNFIINKQKHQIDKKVLRRDHKFSMRLPYADKKIREVYYSKANTNYIRTQDMIYKLQQLKGKT